MLRQKRREVNLQKLKRLAVRLTSSGVAQRGLERVVSRAQLLLGIGAGSEVGTSGESALFGTLKRNTREGQELCLFDVGANRGQFLDLAVSELRPRLFSIHCFEPSEATFKMLGEGRQTDNRVVLNPFALGKVRGEATLYYDSPASGMASLTRRRMDHFGTAFDCSESIRVETIDGYCEDRGIKHIDLLKMDVEGHEMDVLLGAERMLASSVGMVTFEFGGCNIDTRTYFQDFFYFFQKYGMRIYRITPSGFFYPIPKYLEQLEQFRTTNFLAVREGGLDAA
jgi:FkbM family methyltransferase